MKVSDDHDLGFVTGDVSNLQQLTFQGTYQQNVLVQQTDFWN